MANQTKILIDTIKSCIENPKEIPNWVSNTAEAYRRPFSPGHMIDVIAEATETERYQIDRYYDEITGPVADLYERRFQETITESPGSQLRKKIIGFERWIGLDRIAWYILLRVESPSTVIETGVLRRESSLLALEALRRNGKGKLVSFDIGRGAMPDFHSWPTHHEEVGFMVPDELRDR
jgi:hypothetical protein